MEATGAGLARQFALDLRYAARAGFDLVVRVDADGQHGADDIDDVVRPILEARAEVVLGSRYIARRPANRLLTILQWVLDGCLSTITRRRVTDATSGFCALGPRAIRGSGRASSDRLPGAGAAAVSQPECAAGGRSARPVASASQWTDVADASARGGRRSARAAGDADRASPPNRAAAR